MTIILSFFSWENPTRIEEEEGRHYRSPLFRLSRLRLRFGGKDQYWRRANMEGMTFATGIIEQCDVEGVAFGQIAELYVVGVPGHQVPLDLRRPVAIFPN